MRLPSTSARAVIISLTYSPAPNRRQSVRKGGLVTPAMGASTTGGQTRSGPMATGENSAGRAGGTSRFSALR